MTTHVQPIAEVTQRATNALIREIGVVDAIRFLNQFRVGAGNYTVERDQLFEGMSEPLAKLSRPGNIQSVTSRSLL